MLLEKTIDGLALLAIITVTLAPGLAIGRWTAGSISGWYKDLKKPHWNPPNWIFGPVWSVLYLTMSVAMWLVWRSDFCPTFVIGLYLAQLALNHAWSPLFFICQRPDLALADLCLLWVAVLVTTGFFYQAVPLAGQLMMPYLAWVSFAGLLNYRIWSDNR